MSIRLWRASSVLFRIPAAVVGCALIVRVLDEWWSYLPAGTIEDQHRDLALSYTQSGWLLALLTLGGVLGAPLAPFADRGHRRELAVAGALGLAGGLAAFALGAPFAVLALTSAVLGAASDLVILPLESAMADLAGDDLDRWLGRQHLVTWCGDFVGPALLALGAATALGWRGVFALTAAVFVAFAAVLAAIDIPESMAAAAQVGEQEPLWRVARSLLREREILLLAGAELLLLPLDEAFLGFAVARRAGDGGVAAQSLAGGVVVGGIVGSLLIARRGLDRRRAAAGGAVLIVGAFGAAFAPTLALQVAAMGALGLGTAIVWAKVHHRALRVAPAWTATVPTLIGLLATPALFIPVGMGMLADRASITAAMAGAALLTVPLLLIVRRLGGDRISAAELEALDV